MPYGRGPAPATQLPLFVLNAMPYGRGPAGLTTLQAVANRNRHPAGKSGKKDPPRRARIRPRPAEGSLPSAHTAIRPSRS